MIEDMGEYGSGSVPPPPQPPAGPPRSRTKLRGAAAGAGVALVVAAGGSALALSGTGGSGAQVGAAATSSGTSAPSTATPPAAPPKDPRGEFHLFGGPMGLGGDVLHGTYTVAKSGGGYQTLQMQVGSVDAVSSTSITVTSKDGFKATYVVQSGTYVDAQRDGIGSVKKGDTVDVSATVSGSTATVTRLADETELAKDGGPIGKGGMRGFFRGGPGGMMRGGAPATPGTGT